MAFPTRIYGKFGWEKVVSTSKKHKLGTLMELPDGRLFRYALANGAIGAGHLVMEQDVDSTAHDTDLAVASAAAVGDTTVTLTNATAAIAKDLFQDGILYINDVAGEGHLYVVKSHPAATTTGSLVVTLDEESGIAEALTTSSQAGLRESIHQDVEDWDANDIDGIPAGVAPTEVADNEHFWLQTHGRAAVLVSTTAPGAAVTLGRPVIPSTAVDGAVTGYVITQTTTTITNQVVGHAMVAGVDTEYTPVFLTIE